MILRNARFQASAGTGKTWQVTHLYAAMICGNGFRSEATDEVIFEGEPLDCQDILMLTFARNAAAEMRTRIAAQVEAELTRVDVAEKLRYWNLLRSLAGAHISTIHSFAQRLVMEHALLAGVSPGMSVLDETLADEMFTDIVNQALLAEVAKRGDKRAGTMRMLCRARGFTQEMSSSGVVDVIKSLSQKARARDLALSDIGSLVAVPPRPVKSALEAVLDAAKKAMAAYNGTCSAGERLVDGLTAALGKLGDKPTPKKIAEIAKEHAEDIKTTGIRGEGSDAIKEALKAAKETLAGIGAYSDHLAAETHLKRFLPFVQECMDQYQERKRELGVLDYDDLILKALALVRGHGEAVSRFKAIIVDEAQDNSRIQNELIDGLAKACGAKVILCGDWKQSIHTWRAADPGGMAKLAERRSDRVDYPLRTSFRSQKNLVRWINDAAGLDCVLGDRYEKSDQLEPRDIAVVTSGPNVELLLPPWEYAGDLSETVRAATGKKRKGDDGIRDELRFELTGTTLKKVVPDEWSEEERDRLVALYEKRIALEARAVARRIQLLCRSPDSRWQPDWMWDNRVGAWREAGEGRYSFRDVLILLRASTRQDVYEAALREVGIRYTTDGKGKGFYYRQEVQDICSLVAWLAWPYDDVSLIALARSPFVALSDPAIALLASSRKRRGKALAEAFSADDKRAGELAGKLEKRKLSDDARLYLRANRVLRRLRSLAGRLTAVELVREAISLTGFDAAAAGQFHGIQKLANMRKLLSVIQDMERRENLDLQVLAKWLTEQVSSTNAPDAVVFDPEDDAVRISTVHAAKGLTSPVVVVPDLRRSLNRDTGWCQIEDADDGGSRIAAKMQDRDRTGGKVEYPSCNHELAVEANRDREEWEARRLFYVATTRPRDLLILSGETPSRSGQTAWRAWVNEYLETVLPSGKVDALVTARSYGSVDEASKALGRTVDETAEVTGAAIEAAAAAVRQPEVSESYRLPVTTITGVPVSDGAEVSEALREYRTTKLVGLYPDWRRSRGGDGDEDSGPAIDYAEMGTAGHRVLESFDFGSDAPVAERVRDALTASGVDGATADELEARLIATAEHLSVELKGAEHIITELPFVAKMESDGAMCLVDGKIDLVYLRDREWHVLDYKFTNAGAAELLGHYSLQLEIYREAVSVPDGNLRQVHLPEADSPAPVRLHLLGIGSDGKRTAVDFTEERPAEEISAAVIRAARTLAAELGAGV